MDNNFSNYYCELFHDFSFSSIHQGGRGNLGQVLIVLTGGIARPFGKITSFTNCKKS
jgi:hypothetical protein